MAEETPRVEEPQEVPQTEVAAEPPAEDYAERIKTLEAQLEDFATKLESEKDARSKVEERFVESEKQRRLMHFNDVIRTLAVGTDEPEKFAEDLYAIEQADGELVERMLARLRAASEAVQQGELFSQASKPDKGEAAGDPWLAKVEEVRVERFSDRPYAEGWVEAEQAAARENRDLARDYAERTRGGD
jgi:hypothetical protein